jgi:hypothetical protein
MVYFDHLGLAVRLSTRSASHYRPTRYRCPPVDARPRGTGSVSTAAYQVAGGGRGQVSDTIWAPRNIESPEQIQEYLRILESWVRGFPVVYSTEKPDHSQDASYPWVISHRFHIHAMAYLTILNPIRAYLAKTYSGSSSKDVLPIREIGVHYALKVVETAVAWAEDDHHTGGAFYYMVFSLFDTAAVLSAAIIEDEDHSMPQRADVLQGIHKAVELLWRLSDSTKTAAASFRVLYRLVEQVPGLTCDIRREHAERSTPSSAERDPMPTPIQGTQAQRTLRQRIRHSEGDGTPQINQPRAASASSYHTCDSATVGPVPQSQNVAKPDEPDREVTVLGQSPYAPSVDQHLTYGGDEPLDLNRPLASSFVSLEEISPRSDGLASVSLGIEAQFMAPVAMENLVVEPITDPELGEFSRLDLLVINWGSVNFLQGDGPSEKLLLRGDDLISSITWYPIARSLMENCVGACLFSSSGLISSIRNLAEGRGGHPGGDWEKLALAKLTTI